MSQQPQGRGADNHPIARRMANGYHGDPREDRTAAIDALLTELDALRTKDDAPCSSPS